MIKAKYTVVLKTLLDNPETKDKIYQALASYPLYQSDNEEYYTKLLMPTRASLNEKILNHYKYREIGFETVARFIDELEIAMNEIIPKYNQLFKTVEIGASLDSIFDNVDWVSTHTETIKGSSTGSGSTESSSTDNTTSKTDMSDNSKMVHSATPQNNLDKSATDIDTVPFADDMQWNKNISSSGQSSNGKTTSNSSNTSQSSDERTVTITDTKKGNQGVNTYAHDIIKYRDTVINVEQMIIQDKRIKELFMMVY
jgi:hypothetical protein